MSVRCSDGLDEKPTVFEQEYFPEMALAVSDEPYTVTYDELEQEYVVEVLRIEKMLGYTNLESEKGFAFFQGFLKDAGIPGQAGGAWNPGRRYGSDVRLIL